MPTNNSGKGNQKRDLEKLDSFDKLLISWCLCIGLAFLLILVREFYYPQSLPLINYWSLRLSDAPWTPTGTTPVPIFQGHYFGDFQLGMIYSSLSDPYSVTELLPYGYPPFAHRILNLLSQLPIVVTFFLYLLSSLALTVITMNKLLREIPIKIKIPLIAAGLSTCLPLFMALDRGNFVVIAVCLGILGYFGVTDPTSSRYAVVPLIYLSLAISIKTYMVIFCLFLLIRGKRMQALQVVLITIISNLVFSFFYAAGIVRIVYIYIKGLLFYGSNSDPMFPLNGNALVASIARGLDYWLGLDRFEIVNTIGVYSTLIGCCWLLMSLYLFKGTHISQGLKVTLMMSCIQFFPPVSMFYTNIWSIFALCVMLNEYYVASKYSNQVLPRINFVTTIVLIISIAPNVLGWYDSFSGSAWILISVYLVTTRIFRITLK